MTHERKTIHIIGGCVCGVAKVKIDDIDGADSGSVLKCSEGHEIVSDFTPPADRAAFYVKFAALESERDQLRTDFAALERERDELKEKYTKLVGMATTLTAEADHEVSTLKTQLAALHRERDELRAEAKQAKDACDELARRAQLAEATLESNREHWQFTHDRCIQLSTDINDLRTDRDRLRREAEEARKILRDIREHVDAVSELHPSHADLTQWIAKRLLAGEAGR